MDNKRKERLEKLENAISTLKTEYVGLDSILDEIKSQITSWYVTPEIISRPVVVSLWGMTGTGKTSVVKRLVELLDFNDITFSYDCGECSKDSMDLSSSIYDALGGDEESVSITSESLVFIWDEFQNARTIDEDGNEDIKPSLRPVWSLLDSGIIDLSDSYSWNYSHLCEFLDNFIPFSKRNPDIPVEENTIKDEKCVKLVLDEIGLSCYDDRDIPGMTTGWDKGENPYKPLVVLNRTLIKTIISRLNSIKEGSGAEEIGSYINKKRQTLGEVGYWLESVRKRITRPKTINCSKSLIFVIGNLDEAFGVEGDINPDIEADTFYEITKKVSITDIKEALKKRFRAEQIARLGNGLIKYPTLQKESFRKIIKKEVDRILTEFKKIDPIEVEVGESIYNLLYAEGVYPTQGVRPVFTTIGYILTPYLSKILIEKEENYKTVKIECNPENSFRQSSATVMLNFDGNTKRKYYEQPLQLGKIRNPQSRKRRVAASVHEAGHAIVQAYLTGKAPDLIVSVSTDGGGFCSTYDKDLDREIDTREDVDNRVMVSLGGYIAESIVFERDRCLLGSGSDLEEAWNDFSTAAYELGFFDPVLYANYGTTNNSRSGDGISDLEYTLGDKKNVQSLIKNHYRKLMEEVKKILSSEKKLLLRVSEKLSDSCSMGEEEFLEFVNQYGNRLSLSYMKKVSEEQDPKYYKTTLSEALKSL